MTPEHIANDIADHVARITPRRLIALAGPPAVGKSTIAETLVTTLLARGDSAALVPMDGFHLDNATLDKRGLRARKGAPETFDLDAFAALIDALRGGNSVHVPGFDRAADAVVPDMHLIDEAVETLVIEGNYLLLDEPGWRALARHWDLSVYLSAPMATLTSRLTQRWLDDGLSTADATARAEANDVRNARRVAGARLPADLVLGAAT